MVGKIVDIRVRRWLYGVGAAIGMVMLTYGLLSMEQLAIWLGLLAAILGLVAFPNTGVAGVTPRRALLEEEA